MGAQTRVSLLKSTFLILVTGTLASCGGNVFKEMSSKTTRAAILEEIRKKTNAQDFTAAVALIEANADLIPNRSEKMLYASAYAGACGLTFATVFDSLATASGSPMQFAMEAFTSVRIKPGYCADAQTWIESIGPSLTRSTSENIAMFLIGFAKVGTFLRYRADNDVTTGIGDGNLDPGFNSCLAGSLSDNEVKQVMTGFGLMLENLDALGTNLSGSMNGNIDGVGTACTGLGIDCEAAHIEDIDTADATKFRNAIKSHSNTGLGIESCTTLPMCC